MTWRLVDSGTQDPAYTAAADEAMALARSKELVPNTLHLYSRNRPTVSLGYFQKVGESLDMDFCKVNDIAIVRRMTGGRAIYTDSNQLIYGLVTDPETGGKLFEKVCSSLVKTLAILGVEAVHKPPNDVLVGGRKISGSARMNRWGIVLQHGTLILRNEPGMMTGALRMDTKKIGERGLENQNYVTSLAETVGMPEIATIKEALVKGFSETFGTEFESSEFSVHEKNEIERLVKQKYGTDEWNMKF